MRREDVLVITRNKKHGDEDVAEEHSIYADIYCEDGTLSSEVIQCFRDAKVPFTVVGR